MLRHGKGCDPAGHRGQVPGPEAVRTAIFIMREDAFVEGVSADQVIQEAQQVARRYVKQNSRWGRLSRAIPAPAYTAVGALAATALWSLAMLL